MTTILFADPELVIALNRKVIFVNPDDLQIFKEVELPADLTKCGLKIANNPDVVEDEQQQKKAKTAPPEAPCIQHVCLSSNRQWLAVSTSGQKALLLYQCYTVNAKLVSVRSMARTSSALAFASDSNSLLVTDKTGDCYEYDCVHFDKAPRLLFGHLSIVYDVLWTADRKHVITCDRDDKIRVTNYPATHDIHGYCLGHKEFVSGLALLQDTVIASVSGDETMRLWNFESGKQLAQHELPAPAVRLTLRRLTSDNFEAAVLLHQPNESVGIYKIVKNAQEVWKIESSGLLSFPTVIVCNICYANQRLFVVGTIDECFSLKVADIKDAPPAPENWLQMVEKQFQKGKWQPEDVSAWFKKRYDNVSEYLERKKRRIEDKQK